MLHRLRIYARDSFCRGCGEIDLSMMIKNPTTAQNRYSIIQDLTVTELPDHTMLRPDDYPQFAMEAADAKELMQQMWYAGVRPEHMQETQTVVDAVKSENKYLKEVNTELLKLVNQLIQQSAGAEATRARHLAYTTLARAEELAQTINRR